MAGNSSCFVCKSNLESCENAVSLWSAQNINPSSRSNAFNSDELRRCHQDCFVCAVCNSSPEDKAQAYSVSRHHCGQNVESDTLIQALNDFKARSLASKAALENTESSKNFLKSTVGISELKCSCDEPQHIERVAGYGVECTEKNCPKREFIANIYNHHTKSFSDFGSLNSGRQLSSVAPEKFYREFFHGLRHWTYCANEDDVGVLLFILKPESSPQSRGCYRIMVRSAYYLIFGLLSLSNQQDNVPSKEEVVQFLRRQVNVKSSMKAISTPLAKTDLLKMDSAFVKQAYKFGVIYMKENQQTEEELFGNETHSRAFDDFLDLLGQRIRLRGFDKYRAGLDNNNDLTGTHSVYTNFADNEIMFHVSTLLPFEEFDSQKLQRKRHIGNDIVCIVFMEARNTKFIPDCIKSNFLHSFIVVQVDVERNPHLYMVSVVSRADVQPFDPPLHEKHVFEKNDEFRDWILKKLIHAEQACHRVPSFAKLHAKTRELILGGLFKSVDIKSRSEENRNSCPNSSVVHDHQCHITAGQVTRDFSCMNSEGHNREDTVAFLVGDINKKCFIGVKSVMMSKSKVFHKIFSQAIPSANSNAPVIKTSPSSASPILRRAVSWRPGQLVHTGLRSGKVNLEKMRRCKSLNEAEDPYVTLESFTDFENKTDSENPAVMSHLLSQKVVIVKLFQSDVFEVLLEYLHTGSCEPVPSLLPGLLSAAQYYEVEELQQLCVGKIKQVNNVP